MVVTQAANIGPATKNPATQNCEAPLCFSPAQAPTLFESCLRLLVSVFGKLHDELDRRTNGYYKEGDTAVYDLYLGVRLAEASSQAMWGSAHYCVQTSPVQVGTPHAFP
eukprot:1159965-Pelagomonas_calceolata.AAC.4